MQKFIVSAIVPAFNEAKFVQSVLLPLIDSAYIDEVVCVDDGSSDSTPDQIRNMKGVTVVSLPKNHGKAYAIARGIEKAKGDIVLFADADIAGLTDRHIAQLLNPLKLGKFDMVIGYRSSAMEATVGVPLSGERAYFKRDLLPLVKQFEKKGYGLELYLNYKFKNKRKKIFQLRGVSSRSKGEKYPYLTAARLYAGETYQVVNEVVRQPNLFSYLLNSYVNYVHFKNERLTDYLQMKRFLRKINISKITDKIWEFD